MDSVGRFAVRRAFAFAAALLFPTVVHAGVFGPSNYWECVLDKVPSAQNDVVAYTLAGTCNKQFPEKVAVSGRDKVGGLFTVPKASDCVVKYGQQTRSLLAARLIAAACQQVYWPD